MTVLQGADWHPWAFGGFFPEDCGGHSYAYHPGQLTDLKRSSEKARRSSGQWQVVHHHGPEKRCKDDCEVYGLPDEIPKRRKKPEKP